MRAITTVPRRSAVVTIVVALLLGFSGQSPSAAVPNVDHPGTGSGAGDVDLGTVLVRRAEIHAQTWDRAPEWTSVPVMPGETPIQAVERLDAIPGVDTASLNYRYELFDVAAPNDPNFPDQWHLSDVGVPQAWAHGDGSGVTLAVIDGGVSQGGADLACHPFLFAYDATTGSPSAEPESGDPNGSHGTHVAGAALQCSNNGIRTAGMAPGADLLPVRVEDASGTIFSEYLADGIIWAADHGADVINLSLGRTCEEDWPACGGSDLALNDAIAYAAAMDIVMVAASGNEFPRDHVSYPANHPAVIAVGASTATHAIAEYSQGGSNLDLVAPGGGQVAIDGVLQESFDDGGGAWGVYARIGTSFASPLVAGTAGLMLAANPGLSAATIKELLQSTALDLGAPGWDPTSGAGLVQAAAAVVAAAAAPPPSTGDATIVGGSAAVSETVAQQVAVATGVQPERLSGPNRYATAVALSKASYAANHPLLYVTTGLNYPDAISTGPIAALGAAPVLLVTTTNIPAETRTELARLSPGRIVVVGGPAAVSDAVVAQLADFSDAPVERLAGPDRYGTAVQASMSFFADGAAHEVFLATGQSSADALAAGTSAAASPGPLLLTRSGDLPASVGDEIIRLNPARVVIVGGVGAVSPTVEQAVLALGFAVERVAGSDRYDTSARLSRRTFPTPSVPMMVATGENYPDALTATASIGSRAGSLLLTRSADLPGVITAELARLSGR